MDSLFKLDDQKLLQVLDSYALWLKNSDDKWPQKSQEQVEWLKKTLANMDFLQSASPDEFVNALLDYTKIYLKGPTIIRLGENRLRGDHEKIKDNLLAMMSANIPSFDIAFEIIAGNRKITYYSKSFWTPLFQAISPENYPNWNNKTTTALTILGSKISNLTSESQQYQTIAQSFDYLKSLKPDLNFYTLDHLMHYVTEINEGHDLVKLLKIDLTFLQENLIIQEKINTYIDIRNNNKVDQWSESYKWEILLPLHTEFVSSPITVENIREKIDLLIKSNPQSGSFVHWTNLDSLAKLAEKNPKGVVEAINKLLDDPTPLYLRIIDFRGALLKIDADATIGSGLMGYLFAAYDPSSYPIYKDSTFMTMRNELDKKKEWNFKSIGAKYQLFRDIALNFGHEVLPLLKPITVEEVLVEPGITALDGQDFLYNMFFPEEQVKETTGLSASDNTNYWWVNQGMSYEIERKDNYIWAPNDTVHHHRRLNEVRPGDVIIHYANGMIRATSLIIKSATIASRPDESDSNEGLVVETIYTEINPIAIENVQNLFREKKEALPQTYSPFNVTGGVNQGYLFPFTQKAFKLIFPRNNNSWIFQGNPDRFDVIEMLKIKQTESWVANQQKENMQVGDLVYFWKSGEQAGVYGIGEIIQEPVYSPNGFGEWHVDLRIEKFLGKDYVSRENFLSDPILSECKIIKQPQGTNFLLTDNEVERIKSIINQKGGESLTMNKLPLNLILYGPPGTGKTYEAKARALKLVSDQVQNVSREAQIIEIIADLSWKDVIALALKISGGATKVPDLVHNEIIQAHITVSGRTRNINNTIWGKLQLHTSPENEFVNVINRSEPYLFNKLENSSWKLSEQGEEYVSQNLQELLNNINSISENTVIRTGSFVEFITFHQSYSYEEFVEGIRPTLESQILSYELKMGVFKKICQKASKDPQNKYVIIIDEINRGNISKIFGELITLLEEDKRTGAANEIHTLLPYSQELFSVPQNVYIIGTMNTADRSIALLDIALRRRFTFEEIMPSYVKTGLNDLVIDDLNVGRLLEKLNKKIKILLDQDHQIGHSYFMKLKESADQRQDLHGIWYQEVIPLVKEYFYNDWNKLSLLLGRFDKESNSGFVEMLASLEVEKLFSDDDISEFGDVEVGEIYEYGSEVLPAVLSRL